MPNITSAWPEQEVRPGDERLVPKVHVNLGITLEADGRLLAACNHYQCALYLSCYILKDTIEASKHPA